MSLQTHTYLVYGIYFPAEHIDYIEFTEQPLPEGLEWMPVGDQSSDMMGTILAVQASYTDMKDFVGHMFLYDSRGDKGDWHKKLVEAVTEHDLPVKKTSTDWSSVPKASSSACWHIAGWVG